MAIQWMEDEDDAEDDCNRSGIEELVSYIPAMKQHCLNMSPRGGWHLDAKNAVSRLYGNRVDIVDIISSVDGAVVVEPSRVFDIFKLDQERIHGAKTSCSGLQGTYSVRQGAYFKGHIFTFSHEALDGPSYWWIAWTIAAMGLRLAIHSREPCVSAINRPRTACCRYDEETQIFRDERRICHEVLLVCRYPQHCHWHWRCQSHLWEVQTGISISPFPVAIPPPTSHLKPESNQPGSYLRFNPPKRIKQTLFASTIPYQPTIERQINKQTTSHLARMAAIVLALGAAIYITAEKIQGRREKERVLKAKNATKQALLKDDDSVMAVEDLPAYQTEKLPAYDFEQNHHQQHPVLVSSELTESSSQRYYLQARSTWRTKHSV